MLRRAAARHSPLVEVPHPAMFGKHWCVDSFARFTAGMDISRTCAIPPREVIRGAQGDVTSLGRGGEYSPRICSESPPTSRINAQCRPRGLTPRGRRGAAWVYVCWWRLAHRGRGGPPAPGGGHGGGSHRSG